MRLRQLEQKYAERVSITWLGYPLIPGEREPRPISDHSMASRRQAAAAEPLAAFGPWDPAEMYPNTSMRALEAAKCAGLQGEEAFRHYHWALFDAFFVRGKNISDPAVLIQTAQSTGLDAGAFAQEFVNCSQRQKVLEDLRQALAQDDLGSLGIPLVIFNDRFRMIGAATAEAYSGAVDYFLGS